MQSDGPRSGLAADPIWVADPSRFPPTRYQGSKRRLVTAIVQQLRNIPCQTVLDAFGGTGAVAYAFKCAGKSVTYNDYLSFNHQVGLALIENDAAVLPVEQACAVGKRMPGVAYPNFIRRTFDDVYFTRAENEWLDVAAGNVRRINCPYRRAIAWFAVCQAALAKRPYNLFHRRNLYMRVADVPRTFGNKTTWERPFDELVPRFAEQAGRAVVNTGVACRAICCDALEVPGTFDLVYIDPPYLNERGVGVDYRRFYHFLEGLVRYDEWPDLVDESSKHRSLRSSADPWLDRGRVLAMHTSLLDRFRTSALVLSYRSDGYPSIEELAAAMRKFKRVVTVVELKRLQYALSDNRHSRELLVIGTD